MTPIPFWAGGSWEGPWAPGGAAAVKEGTTRTHVKQWGVLDSGLKQGGGLCGSRGENTARASGDDS